VVEVLASVAARAAAPPPAPPAPPGPLDTGANAAADREYVPYKEFAKLKRENRKNNVRTSRKEIGRSIGNCDDPADEVPPLGGAVQDDSMKPRVESAYGFSTRSCNMMDRFQTLLSISTCAATAGRGRPGGRAV
jgi:hypothetical protein